MIIAISGKIGSGKDTVTKIINYVLTGGEKTYVDIKGFLEYYNDGLEMYPFKNVKFAGKLKQMASIVLGIPVEDFEKEEVKNSYLGEEWDYWVGVNHPADMKYQRTILSEYTYPSTTKEGAEKMLEKQLATNKNYTVEKKRLTVRELLQKMGTDAMRNVIHPNFHVNALFADYKPTGEFNTIDDSTIYPNWLVSDLRFPNELEAVKKRGGITIRVNRDALNRIPNYNDVSDEEWNKKYNHPSETSLDGATFDYYINNNGTIEELIEQVKLILEMEKIL